jgi:hypothetical protein
MSNHTKVKPFEEKFEKKNGKWEPKQNEGWQTKGGEKYPTGPDGKILPWADSLRVWMFEMNQWAEQVTSQLNELAEEVEALKAAVPGDAGSGYGDAPVGR